MDITGKVKFIGEIEIFDSGFSKRTIMLTDDSGTYPKNQGADFFKDNTSRLDNLSEGQVVTISVFDDSIGNGREGKGKYEGRWFPSFPTGYKVHVETDPAPEADDDCGIPF